MAEAGLVVDGIEAGYGSGTVLHGLSLSVGRGQIVTLLGPNGAGKSTALKAVGGLLRPRRGSIRFDGRAIDGLRADEIVRRGVALVPERRELFPNLTVQENLQLGAYLRRDAAGVQADREMCLEIFPRLAERRRQAASTLSGGEQQMLAIARGLMSRPRLLLLDEPSLGLSPLLVEEIFTRIGTFRTSGVSVLLVEQNAMAALEVADHGYVLEAGTIQLAGTAAELAADENVRLSYLR
jgi:branched-chain amino acid transport system ATP-binding protein